MNDADRYYRGGTYKPTPPVETDEKKRAAETLRKWRRETFGVTKTHRFRWAGGVRR